MATGTTHIHRGVSHLLEDWICCKSPQPLVELSEDLGNIIDCTPPFVHPMATTSLFAQSKDQQLVSCSSMRSTGSIFTGLAVSCVKNERLEGISLLTMDWAPGVLGLEVSWMRNNEY